MNKRSLERECLAKIKSICDHKKEEMSMLIVTCDELEFLCLACLYCDAGGQAPSLSSCLESYSQMYSICPFITTKIWNNLAEDPDTDDMLGRNQPSPKHLPWTSFFL